MKKKRLDRDLKWGFQHFPYYQMRVESEEFHGLVCLIQLTDGENLYWNLPKAGKAAVAGAGMTWLQLIPDNKERLITAKYLPDGRVSVWYVDVIDGVEYAEDGVAIYVDKYLDVYFTPQGDVVVDDKDELDAAYECGELTKEQYEGAIAEGDRIVAELCADVKATEEYCNKVLEHVKQSIAGGEKPFKEKTVQIQKADLLNLSTIETITQTTIRQIYPRYYPQGAVDFFAEHHNSDNISKDIQHGYVFLCYDNNWQAVGTVTIKENEICRLFVLPEHQGQGYGSAMLDFAEKLIFEKYPQVSLDASLPAKGIYLKRGYVITEAHSISCSNGDYLCYDVMMKTNG